MERRGADVSAWDERNHAGSRHGRLPCSEIPCSDQNVIHSQTFTVFVKDTLLSALQLIASTEQSKLKFGEWRGYVRTLQGPAPLGALSAPTAQASVRPTSVYTDPRHLSLSSELTRLPCLITPLPPFAFHPLANVHLAESPDDGGTLPLLLYLVRP